MSPACSSSRQCDSVRSRLLSLQLQLEIALLQGELQTEKDQLHRHLQKLQALQQEAGQREKRRHTDREKVRFFFFFLMPLLFMIHELLNSSLGDNED